MGGDAVAHKTAFASLLTVILEGAKHDASGADLAYVHHCKSINCLLMLSIHDVLLFSSGLEESKVSEARLKLFATAFDSQKAAIRSVLAQSQNGFPAITGLEWRMDYYMKSNMLENVRIWKLQACLLFILLLKYWFNCSIAINARV